MKQRISAVLLLSLMLSMLFVPLVVTADDGKSIIKEMVQTPADYSVTALAPGDYYIASLYRVLDPYQFGGPNWDFLRDHWFFNLYRLCDSCAFPAPT